MNPERTIRLDLQYDGTDFVGWQIQTNGRSVQGELTRALEDLLHEPVVATGSGRTDAGTHALGQVAHLRTKSPHPCERICRALNSLLPADISVTAVTEADDGFHSRYSAVSKRYRYRIATAKTALQRRWVWTISRNLDLDAMERAAASLIGTHDFRAFCKQHPVPDNFTCTVFDCGWRHLQSELRFEIKANRFLRHMVRIIVGTMVEVGSGRRQPDLSTALNARGDDTVPARALAGATAPARGLCLIAVNYTD